MTPERYRQIGELYDRAVDLPREHRGAFVHDACGDDDELRREVESLLAADENARDFMSAPAIELAARQLSDAAAALPRVVGRYRLVALLGRGGMGEVYLAEDTVLPRKVAIKLLRGGFSTEPRALVRFEQEARAASSLNHPNIVTIHEIGAMEGGHFIAMEFVDGRPLSAVGGSPISVGTLLSITRQLSEALGVAHAAGIVHRDIKPENVMMRPDGYVKLLDFGVARLQWSDTGGFPAGQATITRAGQILGTPRYMSPEQIRGERAAAASDIYALGAVLFELATGRHHSDGGADATPEAAGSFPPALINLIRRMLDSSPPARPSAAEIHAEIRTLESSASAYYTPASNALSAGNVASSPPARLDQMPPRSRRRFGIPVVTAAVAIAAAALLFYVLVIRARVAEHPSNTAPIRFQIVPPPGTAFSSSSASLALSPDGQSLAFTASAEQGRLALWVQPLESLDARKLPVIDSAAGQLLWSPDSKAVAFAAPYAGWTLRTVDAQTGLPRLVGGPPMMQVGSWSPDGRTILMQGKGTIRLVTLDDGASRDVTALDTSRRETAHSFPGFLPDGRRFVFMTASKDDEHDGMVYLASIDSRQRTALFRSDSQAAYAWPGYLLYMHGNTLLARPFDVATGRVTAEAIPVAHQVERNTGSRRGAFTVSQTGVLAYRQLVETQLMWFDRVGRRLQQAGPTGHYRNPAIAPDGRTIAVARLDPRTGTWGVWTIEVDRNVAVRLTSGTSTDDTPVWSPDGYSIAFKSNRDGPGRVSFYRQRADGSTAAERLLAGVSPLTSLHAWSAEGLVYSTMEDGASGWHLWRLPLDRPERTAVPLLESPFSEPYGRPSPDGRWLAYVSDESGRLEVYGAPFPHVQGKWAISTAGGTEPVWRSDGRELYYLAPDRRLMAVSLRPGAPFTVATPQPLFEAPVSPLVSPSYTRNQYVATNDGQRFLINEPSGKPSLSAVTIVVNWPAGLHQRPAP